MMKNKKNVCICVLVTCLMIGGWCGYTRYQERCSVDDTAAYSDGKMFNGIGICRGEYYIKIEDVEPNNKLEMTTSTLVSEGSWLEDESKPKTVKKGDEIIVDKSSPIWYQFTDPKSEETRIKLRLYKR